MKHGIDVSVEIHVYGCNDARMVDKAILRIADLLGAGTRVAFHLSFDDALLGSVCDLSDVPTSIGGWFKSFEKNKVMLSKIYFNPLKALKKSNRGLSLRPLRDDGDGMDHRGCRR